MQAPADRGTEIVIDGGPVQRVRKTQLGWYLTRLEQARGDGFVGLVAPAPDSWATDAIVALDAWWPNTDAAARKTCVAVGSAATRARITDDSSFGAGNSPSFSFNAATPISSSSARQWSACPPVCAASRRAPRCDSCPRPRAAASWVRSPASRPPRRTLITRESPPTNRAHPASTRAPLRAETTMSTLSARSRRSANRTARNEGRSVHCRSSRTSTTTRSSACRRSRRSSKRAPTAIGSSAGSVAASGSSWSTTP